MKSNGGDFLETLEVGDRVELIGDIGPRRKGDRAVVSRIIAGYEILSLKFPDGEALVVGPCKFRFLIKQ